MLAGLHVLLRLLHDTPTNEAATLVEEFLRWATIMVEWLVIAVGITFIQESRHEKSASLVIAALIGDVLASVARVLTTRCFLAIADAGRFVIHPARVLVHSVAYVLTRLLL